MERHKRVRNLLTVCTLLLVCLSGQPVWAADQEIKVIYTNDVHCGIDTNIGYAGLALYQRQLQAQTPYVTLVDAGDALQGESIGTLSQGEYLIDIMNRAGYDAAVPGNHEFDYGMAQFLDLADELDGGYYSCNFIDLRTGQTVFPAYKLISYGDTDVAFIGITTPESFTKSNPKYFQNQNGQYIYSFCEDSTGEALYAQIQSTVDKARAAGAEYVIAVGHLGNEGVADIWSSKTVITNTDGIDAFIDGHSHEEVSAQRIGNRVGKDVLLTQTGTKLEQIGVLTIQTDGRMTSALVPQVSQTEESAAYQVKAGDTLEKIAAEKLGDRRQWRLIYDSNRNQIANPNHIYPGMVLNLPSQTLLADGKAVDRQMYEYLQKLQAGYEKQLDAVLGHAQATLTVNEPDSETRAVRNRETNMGDFTADAYRYVLEADIGLSNGGGIRSDIGVGPVTYRDLLTVFPYDNMGCVIEATGQQIQDALEMSSRSYPEENGGFLQVSGLTYTIRTDIPSSVTIDEKQNFTGVKGEYRVTDILVDGQPLELTKVYTVASHNFLLQDGGDGLNMFMNCPVIRDEVMLDVDVLSVYIRDYLNGTIGEDYRQPQGSGRIKVQ